MKTVKVVTLEATFAELPAARACISARGEGSSLKTAASAAMRALMSRKELKARRITLAHIVMSIGNRIIEEGVPDGSDHKAIP